MMASITVGNGVGYMNIGALGSALSSLPGGRISLIGRNVPSLAISAPPSRDLQAPQGGGLAAAEIAGIDRPLGLPGELGIVDRQLVALDDHLDFDRNRGVAGA